MLVGTLVDACFGVGLTENVVEESNRGYRVEEDSMSIRVSTDEIEVEANGVEYV